MHIHYVYVIHLANLQITVEPQDAYVIEGMSVTLCCEAEGTPPPDYYEWSAMLS